jgi:hypothetical protein
MKKIIGTLLIAAIFCSSYTAPAQTSDKVYLLNTRTMGSDNAAVRATRDFWKRAGQKTNEEWYKLPDGFLAEYTDDGIRNRIVYDKKGYWKFSMQEYREKQLPEDVREFVKSQYYDYSIGWVKEVKQEGSLVYVIDLENDNEWINLAVQDGETRILKQFSKK